MSENKSLYLININFGKWKRNSLQSNVVNFKSYLTVSQVVGFALWGHCFIVLSVVFREGFAVLK